MSSSSVPASQPNLKPEYTEALRRIEDLVVKGHATQAGHGTWDHDGFFGHRDNGQRRPALAR